MKKLLLLGGSADQLYAIRVARDMGLETIVVDGNQNAPGLELADHGLHVSTRDVEALNHALDRFVAENGRIDGVLVQGSDIPHIVSQVAERYGCPHIPVEAALKTVNKLKMKEALSEAGVAVPWFRALSSAHELRDLLAANTGPFVIKPLDRSGARGVFLVEEPSNVEELFAQSKAESFSGQVMVERYEPGLQISTESLMFQGLCYTPGFADRNYEMLHRFAPHIIENGGWVPSEISNEERGRVEALVASAALALGITDGVVKGDVVLTPEGPKLIEVAARLSGGDFCESLIPLGCGVNIVEAAIRVAIGEVPDLPRLQGALNKGVVNRYFFPAPGILRGIKGADEVRKQPWVRKLEFWFREGDMVPVVKSHADRVGTFIVEGHNRAQAENRAQWVYDRIEIIIEPTECQPNA